MTGRNEIYDIFETISEKYDQKNDQISFGQQRKWKKYLAAKITGFYGGKGDLLDLCCGTGDLTQLLAEQNPDMVIHAVDFSPGMLGLARKKTENINNISIVCADAMALPFSEDSFDGVVISFGLRNLPDYGQAIREIHRVLKPGGILWCLESSVPDYRLFRYPFLFYFGVIMPMIARRPEYRWLYQSTRMFPTKRELVRLLESAHFKQVWYHSFSLGVCALHSGRKAEENN